MLDLTPAVVGSFIGMLDSGTGALTKRTYLPFGESPTTSGTFAYTGLRIDPETNGLYYARARIYSPQLGRFVQPDPIGYAGGVNLYAYVGNDPLNLVDRFGLAAEGGGYDFSAGPVRVAQVDSPNATVRAAIVRGNPQELQTLLESGSLSEANAATVSRAVANLAGRPLTAADFGAQAAVTNLQGTFQIVGREAVFRVQMIEGNLGHFSQALQGISATARAAGATSIRIEGTLGNPTLLRALQRFGTVETRGSVDIIRIPLR